MSLESTPKKPNLSDSVKSLRKGSSSENLFNRAAMTLSRKSRRGSSSRDRSTKDMQTHEIAIAPHISKERLTNVLVENRARITTFVRSLQPYFSAEVEQGLKSSQLASQSKNLQALSHIKTHQIQNWVEEQILLYREGQGVDHVNNPLVRHNRKSSVSSVNSISSSKSDSCSSGSMRLTEPPIFEQNPNLRQSLLKIPNDISQYRLSSTSHDSGFTSQAHENENATPYAASSEQDFGRNRTPSWKDWPKPGPYDSNQRSQSSCHVDCAESDFELPPPPPECEP